jgi:hypothetical protein
VIVIVAVKTPDPLVLNPEGEIVQFVPTYWVTHDRPMVVSGNPALVVMVSVDDPEFPGAEREIAVGLADIVKSALLTATGAEVDPA